MIDIQDIILDIVVQKVMMFIELLLWFKKFCDQIVVVKYGGNVMVLDELQEVFVQDIVYFCYVGVQLVVVYGGGLQILNMFECFEIFSEFKGGYCVINIEVISVVCMVFIGQVNLQFVLKINLYGLIVIGFSGEDVGFFGGCCCGVVIDGEEVDFGWVGDVVEVDFMFVFDYFVVGCIFVVLSIVLDFDYFGQLLNVNVDVVVVVFVVVLDVCKFVIFMDVLGFYVDWFNCDLFVLYFILEVFIEMLLIFELGMILKMWVCFDVVEGGVDVVVIIDG